MYAEPRPLPLTTLAALSALDEIHTEIPYYGQRRLVQELAKEYGIYAGRDAVRSLMRILRIEAIYPKPNTSEPHPGHTIYPYLLRGVTAQYPNHIVGTDITYIRLVGGFCYLVAYIDWYSRKVLSWRLSNTMDTTFCIEALQEALLLGVPDILNSDQGSQFTSDAFTTEVKKNGHTKISMNGRGRCLDNIFTERLWRSVKYEDVYIKGYATIEEAREGLAKYFEHYNSKRFHQSLNNKTPNEVYAEIITKKPANSQGDLSTGSV